MLLALRNPGTPIWAPHEILTEPLPAVTHQLAALRAMSRSLQQSLSKWWARTNHQDHAPVSEAKTPPILSHKRYDASSAFTPESLLREARRQKGLSNVAVPEICILDPDGDI